jgi:serine/threonine protein phosphatase PrpC
VAVTNIHDIKDNDIILVASDGLLDNVFTEDIISIIDTYKESSLLIITEKLKDLAFKNGND